MMVPALEPLVESGLACGGVLLAFAAARWLSARAGNPPWASPVLIAAVATGTALTWLGVPVARFTAAAWPLRWLLGPALVALALIIDTNRAVLKSQAMPILVAVGSGTAVGIGSALGLARVLGLDRTLAKALATKTVTTPFAVAIMQTVGGPTALAAALAVMTGVIGALLVPWLFDRLGIAGPAARALGLGVSSHIVGTDWLTRRDANAGGLSALAMVLAGIGAALVLPLLWGRLFGG